MKEMGEKFFVYDTLVISDAETMETVDLRFSHVSKNVIANYIETVHQGYLADGMLTLGSCD